MKNFILNICLFFLLGINLSIYAQDSIEFPEDTFEFTYTNTTKLNQKEISSIDTIVGYESKVNKLKITGTIYKSDGITPAKDVILYIEQADEYGNFDLREKENKRYIYNRASVKTDANGNYTLYTYVPGNDRRYHQLQQIFPVIKEPSKSEYEIASFLFDEDPLLTKLCRKRMTKKGDPSRILKLKKENNLLVTKKDIILEP